MRWNTYVLAGVCSAALALPSMAQTRAQWDAAIAAEGTRVAMQERGKQKFEESIEQLMTHPRELSFAEHAGYLTFATLLDIESTFYVLDRCISCSEKNPVMRPLVERGKLPIYGIQMIANYAILRSTWKMHQEGHPYWNTLARSATKMHTMAGCSNMSILNK